MPTRIRRLRGADMVDGQNTAETVQGPVRMCIICRRRFAKAQLTRHVLTAQGI